MHPRADRTPTSAYSRTRTLPHCTQSSLGAQYARTFDDHRTFGQLRYSVGFTRRRLGPRSEPVVQRMRQLTGELSSLRKGVELPCAPIHGDYKLGNVGELSDSTWATFDLDFARVRERLYDIAGSLNHVAQSGPDGVGQPAELLEPQRLLDTYESTAPEPLSPDEHRWLPGALALIPLDRAATAGSSATSTRPRAR